MGVHDPRVIDAGRRFNGRLEPCLGLRTARSLWYRRQFSVDPPDLSKLAVFLH